MIIKHSGKVPSIEPSAYVAPNAVVCGDVTIGANVRIMHGAQIIAENSSIRIGNHCIILENAVIRGTDQLPVSIGHYCLIGPHAHLAGCTLEDNVFIATGASIFHGALLKMGVEVRVNAVVHLKTLIPENAMVPINWIAVGNPAKFYPPHQHEQIWEIQEPLNFPELVYGIERGQGPGVTMEDICKVMSQRLGTFLQDEKLSK